MKLLSNQADTGKVDKEQKTTAVTALAIPSNSSIRTKKHENTEL